MQRVIVLCVLFLIVYLTAVIALAIAWYEFDTAVPFHWFDDSRDWLFIDKFGHCFTVYIVASLVAKFWRWAGLSLRASIWIAAGIAFTSHSSVEVFDGFSKGYGASVADLLANLLGVSFLLLQFYIRGRIKLFPRLSFHPSIYAHLRPAYFGDTFLHQLLKDYNGHTFWFSLDVNNLLGINILPSWLLLSIGYGADGLLGGDDNIWTDSTGTVHDFSNITRSTRWMFSVDINWSAFNNQHAKRLATVFNYVKVPAPTIEINSFKGLRWHWVYF